MAGDRQFWKHFISIMLAVHYPISIKFGMHFQLTYENSKYYRENLLTVYLQICICISRCSKTAKITYL